MMKSGRNSNASFHCAGAFALLREGEYGTACLTSVDLNKPVPSLQYFPFDDIALARRVKDTPDNFRVYALAQPAGPYQLLKAREISYVTNVRFTAVGLQPVRITNLLLLDARSGAILSAAPGLDPGVVSDIAAPGAVQDVAAVGAVPGASGVPGDAGAVGVSGVTGPRWKLIGGTNPLFYADMGSVRRDGDWVVLRELTDFAQSQAGGYASVVRTLTYNCARRSERQVSLKVYSDRHGNGSVMQENLSGIDLPPIVPNSLGETAFNFACNALAAAQ